MERTPTDRSAHSDSELSLDDAIRLASRSVSSRALERSGISRVRVLSESHFQSLLAQIVRKLVSEELQRAGRGERDLCDVPVDEDGMPIIVLEEVDTPDAATAETPLRQDEIATIQERMEKLAGRFASIEGSLKTLRCLVRPRRARVRRRA